MKTLKNQVLKVGSALCAPVFSARSVKSNFLSIAVRRVAGILLVVAWGMSSQVAAQQVDSTNIWNLPTFTPASGPYQTNWTSLTRFRTPHWYRDAKFGYWAHWDPQSVPEGGDWFARSMYTPGSDQYSWTINKFGNINQYGYKDICDLWKCDKWDPDFLMKLCVASGAKYFWALGNHHDNYDCWNSRYQPWNSMNIGPKKDVVGIWAATARKYGLPVGVSIHATPARVWGEFMPVRYDNDAGGKRMDGWLAKADGVGKWWNGLDPVDLNGPVHTVSSTNEFKADVSQPFSQQFLWRLDDLITKYLPDILWLDDSMDYVGDLPHVSLGLGDTMSRQVTANYFNRMAAAGKSGALSINGIRPTEANASIMGVQENFLPKKIEPYAWQCMTSMGAWHFDAGNPLGYHSNPTSLMEMLVRCTAANGDFVVAIPIRAQGDMYADAVPILNQIGEWLKVNGEAIYSTRPYAVMCDPSSNGMIYYTRTVGHVYAIVSKWPGSTLALPSCKQNNGTIGAVSKVELLASPNPISCAFTQDATALAVTLPTTEPAIPDIKIYAFRITHDKAWINDDDGGIFFHGWLHEIGRPGAFNNDWSYTDAAGDTCRLTFSGTGIEYIAEKGADFGNVIVYLDNGVAQTVSLRGSGTQQVVYSATDLTAGNHTLTLVCQGNGRINVDAFNVANGSVSLNDPVAGDLERNFVTPPDSAKPSCYWHWFNNNVDKEGITRDLEEFKAKGMGGATIYSLAGDGVPQGPIYLSPEWRELYKHALKEADRLGLEIGVNFGSGWDIGGPWITPGNSPRWFLQTELKLTGPQRFSGTLPLPGSMDGYAGGHTWNYRGGNLEDLDYRDVAVVAFREPERARLGDGDARRKNLPAKSNRVDANVFTHPRAVMDPTLTPWSALPDDQPIAPGDVIDLTAKLGPGGTLDWDVPEGTWTIIRTGHRMTGASVNVPAKGGEGLEVDWLSSAALDQQWENLGKIHLADAGSLVGKTLKYFATDSFEDGYPNWTDKLLTEFIRYRGYDPKPYLPVLAGRLVGNAEMSERFLHDYRKTVADCMADNHYGHFAKLAHAQGMKTLCEAAGPSWSQTMCMDALKNLGRCDMPMGEFWRDLFLIDNQNQVGKQTASAAHIYGRQTASAEAFTSFLPHWEESPGVLKPVADRAFCEGINRFAFHGMTCTRPQDGKPGYEFSAGTHFNPNVTWWDQAAGPWLSYVNRCQALLQSGLFAADVLYYNGDGAPNLVEPKHVDPSLGKGYDYDVCNAEVLLTRLSVKAGRLVLPDGMSYRLLVLPDTKRMPVEVVRNIRDLVEAGATVVGPKPESDPGLKNYPACDAEVKKIATKVWGACDGQQVKQQAFGKGRVFWGKPVREILLADGVSPDFAYGGDDEEDANQFANASWIWNAEDGVSAPEAARFFKTEWELPADASILSARAWITADNGFELQVNGKPVCNGNDWRTVYTVDLARHLHAGNNQVQIRSLNTEPAPAGLLARLTVRFAVMDGQTITRVTGDKDWLSSKDGVTWAPALLVGAYGCAPWGRIQSDPPAVIDFIHRTADGTEIYFLANRKDQAATIEASFRVSGRQPELWDPVSGQRRDLPKFESKNGCTTVPLEFEPDGSMFVVFRKKLENPETRARKPEETAANFPKLKPVQEITGPWTVQFDPQWFYPTAGLSGDQAKGVLVFDKLEDWTKRPEPAIRYFSGTAVYRKTFGLADPSTIQNPRSKIHLDLGTVKETAKVRLNGQDLGAVWCHPWRVEITGAIKPGENKLEIEVVNLWPNRLAGDSKLPAEQRRTRTNIQVESALSAGLLGPVQILISEK